MVNYRLNFLKKKDNFTQKIRNFFIKFIKLIQKTFFKILDYKYHNYFVQNCLFKS